MLDESKKADFALIAEELIREGINYIGVYYEGSGDNGAIESTVLLTNETLDMDDFCYNTYDEGKNFDLLPSETQSAIEDLCYTVLEGIEDWVNNDGGFGHLLIKLEDLTYEISNNVRYTETINYPHDGKI